MDVGTASATSSSWSGGAPPGRSRHLATTSDTLAGAVANEAWGRLREAPESRTRPCAARSPVSPTRQRPAVARATPATGGGVDEGESVAWSQPTRTQRTRLEGGGQVMWRSRSPLVVPALGQVPRRWRALSGIPACLRRPRMQHTSPPFSRALITRACVCVTHPSDGFATSASPFGRQTRRVPVCIPHRVPHALTDELPLGTSSRALQALLTLTVLACLTAATIGVGPQACARRRAGDDDSTDPAGRRLMAARRYPDMGECTAAGTGGFGRDPRWRDELVGSGGLSNERRAHATSRRDTAATCSNRHAVVARTEAQRRGRQRHRHAGLVLLEHPAPDRPAARHPSRAGGPRPTLVRERMDARGSGVQGDGTWPSLRLVCTRSAAVEAAHR